MSTVANSILAIPHKFGKLKPKRSLKSLALSNYMNASKVAFPAVHAWERPISYGMLANDRIGDCAIAAPLHEIMNWKAVADASNVPQFTGDQAIKEYSAITGYNPLDPSTDNGSNMLDVVRYWQSIGMAGHKIDGYATLDLHNVDMVKAAIYLFGGIYAGIVVPQSVVFDLSSGVDNRHWNYIPNDKPSDEGHAIYYTGYGRRGSTFVSWGSLYDNDWDFWLHWTDEGYVVWSTDWIKHSGISPSGLDMAGLLADSKLVG